MDKELLRLVIGLIGLLAMVLIVIWHFIKGFRSSRQALEDEADDDDVDDFDFEEDDEFAVLPVDFEDEADEISGQSAAGQSEAKPASVAPKVTRYDLPKLIEFSIVARADEGFNGEDLFEAFEAVGLRYGSVKVFERIDSRRMVDFAVASMSELGTFPADNLDQFSCPGIVFFMQPRELDNPAAVFEDFIDTIQALADRLDGVAWDNQRQPLTLDTIEQFREILAD
ncbi:MAG: cell division protein ZipA C-terminal FtsZ-binding domain-containing protein [Methylomonas sp.]